MRWEDREESQNIDDRRGMPIGGMVMGGGLGSLVIILLAMFLGMNPKKLIEQPGFQQGGQTKAQLDPAREQAEAPVRKFVSVVFRDTEDVWTKLFREQLGRNYEKPKLVLFTDQVNSACAWRAPRLVLFIVQVTTTSISIFPSFQNCSKILKPKVTLRWLMSLPMKSGITYRIC